VKEERRKREMLRFPGVVLLGFFILILAKASPIMGHEDSTGEIKIANGIKATFKVTPSMSMVDVILSYGDTGKSITKAKVSAKAKGPDGKIQEKELVGMKMGKEYSFGNTFDLSKKGKYSFDVLAEVGKQKVRFNFSYEGH
jgi:hypothetical protein